MITPRNIRELKTTVVGIVLLTCGIFYLFSFAETPYSRNDFWILGTLLVVGIFMLLAPNKILGVFNRFFDKLLK